MYQMNKSAFILIKIAVEINCIEHQLHITRYSYASYIDFSIFLMTSSHLKN